MHLDRFSDPAFLVAHLDLLTQVVPDGGTFLRDALGRHIEQWSEEAALASELLGLSHLVPPADGDVLGALNLPVRADADGALTVRDYWKWLARIDRLRAAALAMRDASPAAPAPRGKGGRPRDTDPKRDEQIAVAWRSGHYRTYRDLADALNALSENKHRPRLDAKGVELALDRDRKRPKG